MGKILGVNALLLPSYPNCLIIGFEKIQKKWTYIRCIYVPFFGPLNHAYTCWVDKQGRGKTR
jgi:hypothetical protein